MKIVIGIVIGIYLTILALALMGKFGLPETVASCNAEWTAAQVYENYTRHK